MNLTPVSRVFHPGYPFIRPFIGVITPFITGRGPTLQAFLCLHHHNPGCCVFRQLPFLQLSCNMVSRWYAVIANLPLNKKSPTEEKHNFQQQLTPRTTRARPTFFWNTGPMFTKRSPRRMRYASAFLGYLRRAVSWPKKTSWLRSVGRRCYWRFICLAFGRIKGLRCDVSWTNATCSVVVAFFFRFVNIDENPDWQGVVYLSSCKL